MKAQHIKGALAALIAAAAACFRTLLGPLAALVLVMASDYVTGVLAAYRAGELSSRTGLLGICKKLGYLFCVGVAVAVDFTVRTAGESLGLGLEGFCAFGLLVTVWLILNECLSILENLTELGVPVPGFLRAVVERLKGSAERAGEAPLREETAPGASSPRDVEDAVPYDTPSAPAAQRLPLRQGELSAKLTEGIESAPAATTPPSPAGDTSPYTGEAAREEA